jgi:hypothetical protein
MHEDPERAKKDSQVINFFAFLGSAHIKAAHGTMMKLTPGVNFYNILPAAFSKRS